jgi:transcriptional regulator with XRE-family HTH domain
VIGDLIREARERHGVSQRALARRAGTSQAAISRVEAGLESPTVERVQRLLLVLGEQLALDTAPLPHDADPGSLAAAARLTPEERFREAASWNRFASKLEIAARTATL